MTTPVGATAQTHTSNLKLSFHEFKKQKEDERAIKIKSSKKAKAVEVKIQIGVMEELDGRLKRIKGRTLPLKVPSNVTAKALLKVAIDKHTRHFKQFNQHLDHVLLYPDQTIIQTLPGSPEPFVLNKYIEELGKPFSKLYFWLCRASDIESCIDYLDGESESSEPGPSCLTDTVITIEESNKKRFLLKSSKPPS